MKKLLLILLVAMFMISFTSAYFEFDNYYSYDESTRTATFKNGLTLGSRIAEIRLNTPNNMKVAPGYNYVFELEVWGDVEYSDFVRGIYVHDIKNAYGLVNRDIDLKYFNGYETKYKDIGGCVSESLLGNGTLVCDEYGVVGTEEYQVEIWDDLLPRDLKQNDHLRVRGYTNIEVNERMEWYIDFFGAGKNTEHGSKGVKEWATWTASLNVDLTGYWKFDEQDTTGSGIIINEIGPNAVNSGADNSTGIIKTAYNYIAANSDCINLTEQWNMTEVFSTSIWFNASDVTTDTKFQALKTFYNYHLKLSSGELNYSLGGDGGDTTVMSGITTNTWYNVVVTHDGVNSKVYVNSISKLNNTPSESLIVLNNVVGCEQNLAIAFFSGIIDEVGVWDRVLTNAEVIQLWNGGLGISFISENIQVALNAPANDTIQGNSLVEFNWTISPTDANTTNWTLSVFFNNGTLALQEINTSINTNETLTVLHNETITDGNYIWNVESCAVGVSNDVCGLSENRTFLIDTINPLINITSPADGFVVTQPLQNITINFTVNDSGGTLDKCWLNTSLNSTPAFVVCADNTTSVLYPISAPDNVTIFLSANDTAGNTGITNVTIFKDQTLPQIDVESPLGLSGINSIGGNETLNVTFNDTNLDTCWFDYNGTNVTIEGCLTGIKNSTIFILQENNLNMTIYANDTFGNENNTFISWNYFVIINSQTFNLNTTEGSTETFILNYTANETPTSINFIYNGSVTSADIDASNFPTIVVATESIVIPNVDATTNLLFLWNIISTSSDLNTTATNQTVNILSLDNCSSFSNVLFNYTMVDEATQIKLNGVSDNVSLEVEILIFDASKQLTILNFSTEFNQTNSNSICSLTDILNGSTFVLDSTVKYSSGNHEIEYYNIRDFTIDNTTSIQNITLFDILISESTDFQITFKNSDFVVVEGALIQVNRQYVSEGVFKTVELPITDSNGQTVVHLVQNDVVYNYIVTKDNVILGTFNNLVAFCDDATIGQCFILLNAVSGTTNAFNPDVGSGISISASTFNETTRDLSFAFTTNDGSVRTILLSSIKMDQLGNTTVCNTTVTSSSGTLTCNVPASIGNETIIVSIFVDGTLSFTSYFKAANDIELGVPGLFLLLFLVVSLAMMFSESKSMIIMGVILGFVTGGVLFFIQGGIVGGGSAVMWLIIMGMIMIWKLNSEGQT